MLTATASARGLDGALLEQGLRVRPMGPRETGEAPLSRPRWVELAEPAPTEEFLAEADLVELGPPSRA